ncbi:MAG: PAS domain-containing protein [Pirellulales bacterium]
MNKIHQKVGWEFFDLSVDLYCTLNQGHQFTFANKAFNKTLGFSEAAFLNRSILDYVQLADRDQFLSVLNTLASGDEVVEFESRLICENGTERHFSWRINIPEGSDEVYATARDITEQKRHSSIIEQTHRVAKVGGWEFNFITNELFWSDETYRLHDTTPDEFTPDVTRAIDFYAPESVPAITEALRAAQEEGSDWDLELQLITIKGRRIWVISKITEQHSSQILLEQSEKRFRSYYDLGLVGMALTSPKTGWLHVNARLCEIFGYPQHELLEKTWVELTHPDDIEKDLYEFERVLSGETDGYSLDKRFYKKMER